MLLSLVQGYRDTILVDLAKFQGFHAAGVPNGAFFIQGVTPPIDGVFEAHRWNDRKLRYPDTVSLRLVHEGNPTKPDHVEKSSLEEDRERIDDLFKELEALRENMNQRASQDTKPNYTPTSIVSVLKYDEPLFQFEGEHVQLDINWDLNSGCQLLVWGYERHEDEEQQNRTCLDVKVLEGDEYIIRLGS